MNTVKVSKLQFSFSSTLKKERENFFLGECFIAFWQYETFRSFRCANNNHHLYSPSLTQWILMEFGKYLPKSIMFEFTSFFVYYQLSKIFSEWQKKCGNNFHKFSSPHRNLEISARVEKFSVPFRWHNYHYPLHPSYCVLNWH